MKAAIPFIHTPEVASYNQANCKEFNFLAIVWTAYKQFTSYEPRPEENHWLGIEATDPPQGNVPTCDNP
ncbi:MAG: hypothetical protein WCP60_07560 [bacterium]